MSVITLIPSASLSAFLLEGSNAYLSRVSPHLQFCSSPSSGNGKDACKTYEHFLREGCVGSREVKKVYQAKSVKVTHACVLGDSSPITFKVIFKSLGGTNGCVG